MVDVSQIYFSPPSKQSPSFVQNMSAEVTKLRTPSQLSTLPSAGRQGARFRRVGVNGKIHLLTPRLLLRPAEPDDVHGLHECMTDEETMRYWSCAPYTSLSQTTDFLGQMIDNEFNGYLNFSICLHEIDSDATSFLSPATPTPSSPETDNVTPKSKYTFIGKAGLYDGKEIGFLLNRKYWGKGYAFEALDSIIHHYWTYTPLDEPKISSSPASANLIDTISKAQYTRKPIKADVDPRNAACLKLLKKLGFVEVGYKEKTFNTHLGWCDSVYLEMKRPSGLGAVEQ